MTAPGFKKKKKRFLRRPARLGQKKHEAQEVSKRERERIEMLEGKRWRNVGEKIKKSPEGQVEGIWSGKGA